MLALGQLAFDGCLRLLRDIGYDLPRLKFGHSAHFRLDPPSATGPRHLLGCYHPSRQNTQTGRLTPAMMNEVFSLAKSLIEAG